MQAGPDCLLTHTDLWQVSQGDASWTRLTHHTNPPAAGITRSCKVDWIASGHKLTCGRYPIFAPLVLDSHPESCCSSPAMTFSSVDFPQPLGPTTASLSPALHIEHPTEIREPSTTCCMHILTGTRCVSTLCKLML